MVGQFGVGKTTLVRRFVDGFYDESYLTTVGVKIDRKDITVGDDSVALMLWDLAGEDALAQLKTKHLRGASGYILVADGCRAATLAKAIDIQGRITEELGDLPFVLVINKTDLRESWEVQPADIAQCGWPTFETSAKLGEGVEEMFRALAEMVLATSEDGEE
jgi:hypothetical protein